MYRSAKIGLSLIFASSVLLAQELFFHLPPLDPSDPKGQRLGPGVPRTVDDYGNVIGIDQQFTSRPYAEAAFNLMVGEASQFAKDLHLPEQLPITVSNITGAYVSAFGMSYRNKGIGTIITSNYAYFFAVDDKLNHLCIANYDQTCLALERQEFPITQIDTNAAYQLATQWLASAGMDVTGLNSDCEAHVALSPYWNGLTRLGETPKFNIVPIYSVWWHSGNAQPLIGDTAAYVELYLPARKLLQLDVIDPEYILRKPLVFTNLASLFPGTARIQVITNWSIPVQVLRNWSIPIGPKGNASGSKKARD